MRTNIDIDDELLKEAIKRTKITVKKDLVKVALEELIKMKKRERFKELQGKVVWEGNLEKMRTYDKWDRS